VHFSSLADDLTRFLNDWNVLNLDLHNQQNLCRRRHEILLKFVLNFWSGLI